MSLILAALLLFQDKEGADLVTKAVTATKEQKSFETTFKARYSPPAGAVLDYEGQQVWVAPGVLYMSLKGSAQFHVKAIRTGHQVWTYSEQSESWDSAAANGHDDAAQGVQNPVALLELIGSQAESATRTKAGASITLTGDALKVALKHHAQGNDINWKASTASVELTVDTQGRLKTLTCNATMAAPALKGKIGYTMEVSLVGYNAATELKFKDAKDGPLPPSPKIQQRIAEVLEGRKP